MPSTFKGHDQAQEQMQEGEASDADTSTDKEGLRPWQYVKIKVPAYQWEIRKGKHRLGMKPDTMARNLKEGQQSWWYDRANGGRNGIRIYFPLRLWGEVGHWRGRLKWGDRNAGLLRGVTWLELLADSELASSINCMRPQSNTTWGARVELLRGIVKLLPKVKGPGAGALEFGAKFLSGLLRRPEFVAGEATIKAIAVNAWQWAEEDKAKRIQLHNISYRNFKRGEFTLREVQERLNTACSSEDKSNMSMNTEGR